MSYIGIPVQGGARACATVEILYFQHYLLAELPANLHPFGLLEASLSMRLPPLLLLHARTLHVIWAQMCAGQFRHFAAALRRLSTCIELGHERTWWHGHSEAEKARLVMNACELRPQEPNGVFKQALLGVIDLSVDAKWTVLQFQHGRSHSNRPNLDDLLVESAAAPLASLTMRAAQFLTKKCRQNVELCTKAG